MNGRDVVENAHKALKNGHLCENRALILTLHIGIIMLIGFDELKGSEGHSLNAERDRFIYFLFT